MEILLYRLKICENSVNKCIGALLVESIIDNIVKFIGIGHKTVFGEDRRTLGAAGKEEVMPLDTAPF